VLKTQKKVHALKKSFAAQSKNLQKVLKKSIAKLTQLKIQKIMNVLKIQEGTLHVRKKKNKIMQKLL